MFGLCGSHSSGNSGSNSTRDRVLYCRIHCRRSCDCFKTGDYCRELVCVCEPKRVIRRQGLSSCSCTMLGQGGLQKKGRYKEVDEGLQARINSKPFGVSCILLKLRYHASKRGCFTSSQRKIRIQDGDENLEIFRGKRTKRRKKNIYKGEVFLTELRNKLKGSELRYFEST